jgi:hypothetical protein
MKYKLIGGLLLGSMLYLSANTAANAANWGSKEANLQAMRWYAQQQMSQGMPNPYPGVNLYNGAGFSEFRRAATNGYFGGYPGYGYGSGYGYGYGNPYYGSNYGYFY